MKENINDYNSAAFELRFKQTEIYQKLIGDYDHVTFAKNWGEQELLSPRPTPRQEIGDKHYIRETWFSAVPFYYLEFLLKKNPDKIYDIGCGWNIFKKYIPNIIGIDAENPNSKYFYGDIHDYVDDEFIKGHQNYFKSAFSINALHFVPLSNLKKVVTDFYSILAADGVGWISLNLERMIERDIDKFGKSSQSELDTYVRNELDNNNIDYLVFDVDLSVCNEAMNGNIRLVMHKK